MDLEKKVPICQYGGNLRTFGLEINFTQEEEFLHVIPQFLLYV